MSVARDTVAGIAVRRSSETQLLDHALRGDAVAFSEIHRRFSGRVFAFCLARLLSVDAAQDATQEVFLRLLSADPEKVRSISGWLFGVARHVCIDVTRSRQRTVPTEPSAMELELGTEHSESSAEEEMLSKAEASDMFLALRRMRPRYRTVLVMRDLHGQSVSEIADALAINTGTAYTLLSRARDAFGKAYSQTRDLPTQCRDSIELAYRQAGSGISESDVEKLQLHLAQCPHCRREARRAKDTPLLAGLLPLLPMEWSAGPGLLAQAARTLGGSMPSLSSAAPAVPSTAWASTMIGTAIAGAVLLGVAVVPSQLQSRPKPPDDQGVQATMRSATHGVATQSAAMPDGESEDLRKELRLERQIRATQRVASAERARESAGQAAPSSPRRASGDSPSTSKASGTAVSKSVGGSESHSTKAPSSEKASADSGTQKSPAEAAQGESSKGEDSSGAANVSGQGKGAPASAAP